MRVFFNKFRTYTLAALTVASVASCTRPKNYTPIVKECIEPKTTLVIDSLIKEGQKITDNPEYIYLGGDTLELNRDFAENPDKFFEQTSLILRDKFNDKVCKSEDNCVFDNVKRIGSKTGNVIDMYIDKTPVITSPNVYTTGSKGIYIPVELYGRVNPEISDFL